MNNGKISPKVLELVKQIPNVNENVDPEYFCLFAQKLFSESDRAAVIVGAANLDALLLQCLQKHAPSEDWEDMHFARRIEGAFTHGIVHQDLREWLHDMRRLRNEFAHKLLLGSDLTDWRFDDCLMRLTRPGRPAKIYYQIAEACGCDLTISSPHQVNLRTRIVAYCAMLRRAIECTNPLPIRWIHAPGKPIVLPP